MPVIPRIGPGEVVPLRPVRPDDVGGGAGQAALSDAAQTLAATTARLVDAEREAAVSQAEVMGTAEIAELTQALEQEPDIDAREQKFEEGRNAILKRHRDTLRGGQYQAAFDQRMFQHGERAKLAVREGVIRKRLDNARGGVIESVDKFDRLIEHAESDQLRKGYIFARSNILEAGVSSGAISAAERAQIEERSRAALEQVELRRTSQQTAAELFQQHGDGAVKVARDSIEDPQKQDLVVARLKDLGEEQRAAQGRAKQAQADELWRRYWLPPDDPGKLTRVEVEQMQNLDKDIRNPIMAGFSQREQTGTTKTDPLVYSQAIDLYTNPRRADEAARTPPETFFGGLALEQQNHIRKLSRGEFEKQEPLIKSKVSQRVRAFIQAKSEITPKEKQQALLYEQAVQMGIESERLRLGRVNLSDDEIDAVADKQLEIAIPAKAPWFSVNTPAIPQYQVTAGPPADDRIRIRTKFQANGIQNPTEEAIREAWRDELGVVEP